MSYQVVISGPIVKKENKAKKDKDGNTKPGEFYRSISVDTGQGYERVELEPEDFDKAIEGHQAQIVMNRGIRVWDGQPKFALEVVSCKFKAA